MEPSSILTLVFTSLSVVVKTSLSLKELSQKYRSADQEISFIIVRLNTIEAIVSQIGSWLRSGETIQQQMAADIQMAVSACDFVVGEIYSHVERVQDGWFGGRIRHIWNEAQQLQYQRNLDNQISALGVLLNIAVLKSQCQQRELLQAPRRSTSHDESAQRDPTSPPTNFRTELFQSRVYKAAARKRNADSEQRAFDGTSDLRTADGADAVPPSMNAVFGGSSSSSTVGVISERKGLTRRLGWRNDNHTTLSEQLRDAVIKGQSSAVDQLCSDGADTNYRLHHKSDAGGAKSTGVKSALRRAVHRPYGHGEPTLLHHAAEKGNLEVIRTLVSHGALLDARDRDARTPLHLATDSAAELLLSLGASASAQDRKASTPLHSMAARGGHSNAVAALLKSGANVNAFDRAQQTPLHLACACGVRKTAAILAEAGAFVDASDADGLRPLHLAAQHGHDGIVRGLLRAGADPEAASRRGWRPIHYAAAGTNVRTVQALLAVPVDFDVPAAEGGRTPLHVAAKSGGKGVMELFLKAGAGIELADDVGNTPLISVVGSGHADVVDLLLRYEARVDVANQAGQTPLSTACSRSSSALIMVQMLLTSGARVRYEDYVSLWRNSSIPAREKKAIHAELDAVAPEELKKDEVEWLMTTL